MAECKWPMLDRHRFEFNGKVHEAYVYQEEGELAYEMLTESTPFAFFYKMRNRKMPPHMEDRWRWDVVGPRWGDRVEHLTMLHKLSEKLKNLCEEYHGLAEEAEDQWPTDHVGRALREEFDADDVAGLREVLSMYVDKLSDIHGTWVKLAKAALEDLSVRPAVDFYDACKFSAEELQNLWDCSSVPPESLISDQAPFRQVMTTGMEMADSLAALEVASYDDEGVDVLGRSAKKLFDTLEDILYHPEFGMDNCNPLCPEALLAVLGEDADVPLEGEDLAVWPLYCYQHSGLAMSTSKFSCGWDSGQVGWIAVSKRAYAELGSRRDIDEAAQEFAEMLGKFLDGSVYDYHVCELDEDGERSDQADAVRPDGADPWEYMTAKELAELFMSEELRIQAAKDQRSLNT